ncbi:hypothetical protein Cylst_2097 [Cylindrospermum stagnale PCC 7417]|uniref:Uncharacterized protein n=1 Tax=Cylindrospermum stagnale PCC 7417 TaxID=56107 RepID=K9WX14_9NOST|nr:hypothetical protein Cylst_2097 [Cylindrospermum stagnale PCC 7417]
MIPGIKVLLQAPSVASRLYLKHKSAAIDPSLTYRDEVGVVLRVNETIESLFQSRLSLIGEK